MLIYSDYVKENAVEFEQKVVQISGELGIDPNWLMAVIWIECKMNHKAQNRFTKATGLIQFLPVTAQSLGTSVDALLQMSNLDQLDYVLAYLKQYKNKLKKFVDVYFAVFYPAAIGKYYDYVLGKTGLTAAKIAKNNPGLDLDKNEQVTKLEVQQKILTAIDANYHQHLV